jgi:rRNA maturation endonuclease Nob1
MGLFNKLGRQVEQFKQSATEAAEESADYHCRACASEFHTEYDECPDCGSQDVVASES